jgi:photosystem II stability/assembly factor-like uncharacterized protein
MRPAHFLPTGAFALAMLGARVAGAQWTPLDGGTSVSMRGLSVVSSRIVWASGERGTVLRTTNGGSSWELRRVSGAETMDLRAVHGRSSTVAHVAATAGRIWRTTDGGTTWTLRYQASDTSVFLDAIEFWDDQRGIALGDPMGGRFLILVTTDGGETWRESPQGSRPAAIDGEAAFAASGSSLALATGGRAWLGSGGSVARLHQTTDWGASWTVAATPIRQGSPSQGIFAVAAPATGSLIIVGGDYQQPDSSRANVALSRDGRSFTTPPGQPAGFRSGAAVLTRGSRPALVVAVGTSGSDISYNHGGTWEPFGSTGYHAVRVSPDGVFFASGGAGRLARFDARVLTR